MMDLKTHLSSNTLELQKGKGTDYVLCWNSQVVYNFKRNSLHIAFLHSTKLSGYSMETKFDKDPLAVAQNNCEYQIL